MVNEINYLRMTTKRDKPVPLVCHAPFVIECMFHSRNNSIEWGQEWTHVCDADVSDNAILYLSVKTPINSYDCRVRMAAMNALFEAIRKEGVTIEFTNHEHPIQFEI